MLAFDREGMGPRVVLVHGFTQTRVCWGALPAALSASHEVVLVDTPGHGRSDHFRADLPGTADLLASFGPATFVGYSMGGRMCLELSLRHPESVRGLVLISATAGLESEAERGERRATDEALADQIEADGVDAFIEQWLSLPLFAGLPATARFESERRTNTAEGLASSLRLAGTGTQIPSWGRLHTLDVPVLVVAGAQDAKFTALAHRLADAIGANATLAVLPDAGHTTHLESSDAFLAVLRPWLAAHHL